MIHSHIGLRSVVPIAPAIGPGPDAHTQRDIVQVETRVWQLILHGEFEALPEKPLHLPPRPACRGAPQGALFSLEGRAHLIGCGAEETIQKRAFEPLIASIWRIGPIEDVPYVGCTCLLARWRSEQLPALHGASAGSVINPA